jgi:hypothetical protein
MIFKRTERKRPLMKSFNECMQEYKSQLKAGDIKKAYKGIMEYMSYLMSHLENKYPDCTVSGSIYQGYMDMTYFAFCPSVIKSRQLKIAVVFLHEECRFDVWLSGVNKQVQMKYWKLLKESCMNKYLIPPSIKGSDSIMQHILVKDPDFNDLDVLTKQIEDGVLEFTEDVIKFVSDLISIDETSESILRCDTKVAL